MFLVRDVFRSSALAYGLLTAAYPLGVLSGIAAIAVLLAATPALRKAWPPRRT